MKKLNLKILFHLPFLFSFVFLWRILIFENASINFLDILLIIAIFASFWILIKEKWLIDIWSYWTKQHCLIFVILILFFFSAIIALIINLPFFDWTKNLGIIKSFISLPIFFSIFIVFFINKSFINLVDLWKSFFISIGIISIVGIVAIARSSLTFDNRLSLFYDSPNHLAMILSPAIIIGLWMMFYKNSLNSTILSKKASLYLTILILIALITNLLFTKSLGAIIAIFVSIIFLYLSNKKRFKLTSSLEFFILGLIIISLIITLNTSYFIDKFNYSPSIPSSSIDSRIAIYQSGEKIAKNNFLWGIGPGNFQSEYLNNQKYFPLYPQWAVPHAHNNLLHIHIELGIIALITLLLLISIKILIKQQKKPEKILVLAIIIYFLVHGIFDTTLWHNDSAFLFWLTLLLL